jgi:hypothetical protein
MIETTPLDLAAIAVVVIAAGALLAADHPPSDPRRSRVFPRVVIATALLSMAGDIIAWLHPQPLPALLLGLGTLALVYAAHRRARTLTTTHRDRPRQP